MDDTGSPSERKMKSAEYGAKKITSKDAAITNATSFQSPITNPMLVPELWDLIFRNVVTDDYLRVINSCPEWNQLLDSRKTTELFSMALPFIMKFLPKNDFLNLRLVSQDWKRKCEIIYDNHPTRLATATSDLRFPLLSSSGRMLPCVDDGIKFDSVESFERFNSEMGNDCGNPFPGRCVWLLLQETDKEEDFHNMEYDFVLEYWNAINQFLLQFGDHIWYLRLDFLLYSYWLVPSSLRNMLLQVPNLKRLRLSFGDAESDSDSEDGFDLGEFNHYGVKFFKQNPPFELKNLEVFSCTNPDSVEADDLSDFINQLVKSYCSTDNLKRLNLPDISYIPTPIPNLLELQTQICYLKLPALKEASPKLEKFSVNFQFESGVVYDYLYQCQHNYWDDWEDVDNNVGVVFNGLHIFAETLKELVLFPVLLTSNRKTRNFKVELPNLEKLRMAYSLPIDHLLELKSLKYLEIDESPIFRDQSYCFNIFEKLPKLQKVVHTNKGKKKVMIRPL